MNFFCKRTCNDDFLLDFLTINNQELRKIKRTIKEFLIRGITKEIKNFIMLKLIMGFLEGKKILIVGVANKFSIASGIAESMHNQGAELILSYQSERLKDKVMKLGNTWDCETYIECDVSNDESISNMMDVIKEKWGYLDGIVHAVGFACK